MISLFSIFIIYCFYDFISSFHYFIISLFHYSIISLIHYFINLPLQLGGYLSTPSQSGTHSYILTPENEERGGERGGVMNLFRPLTKPNTILNDLNNQATPLPQRFNDEDMIAIILFFPFNFP